MKFQPRNLQFYLKLFRPVSSATSPAHRSCVCTQVSQFHQDQTHQDWRSKCYKGLLVGIVPLVYYIYKNHADHIIPTVHAVSEVSARKQHNFIADVVERTREAVVCIELIDSNGFDFFGTGMEHSTSNGSGFIIDENGMILTNAHVILAHPRVRIQVKLPDGTVYPAQVAYVDLDTDLALIHIKAKTKLPTLKLGTSSDLRAGEFVIAMGSPLNLANTVTSGIVSATNRKGSELNLIRSDMSYIQTDAAITFGNSGGPLINLDGEVVGVNAIRVAQGSGISFAIPADHVNEFLERAKNKPSHTKARGMGKRYLGLTMMTLKPEVIQELKLRHTYIPPEITEGALIWKVVVGSPAYKSGIMPGDIVTEMNGHRVTSSSSIYEAVEKYDELHFIIFRFGSYVEVVVRPEDVF